MWICRPGFVYALCVTTLHHIFLHFGNSFNSVFLAQWMEQVGWTAWPAPSLELNPIDFYVGRHLWSTVYSAEFCDM